MEFSRVKDGLISVADAAESLGMSKRQARRVWRRYREVGDAGVIPLFLSQYTRMALTSACL